MMKRLVLIIALALFLSCSSGHARGYEAKKKAGDYDIEVKIDRNPIVLGDNRIQIEVKKGVKIVRDAKVLVNYYMPPMPRMPPMNYRTYAKLKREKYEAVMNIIMTGPWIIVIKIYQGENQATTRLNVDAQ